MTNKTAAWLSISFIVISIITASFITKTDAYEGFVGGMQKYEEIQISRFHWVIKVYDHDEGVLCYTFRTANGSGISCIKDE